MDYDDAETLATLLDGGATPNNPEKALTALLLEAEEHLRGLALHAEATLFIPAIKEPPRPARYFGFGTVGNDRCLFIASAPHDSERRRIANWTRAEKIEMAPHLNRLRVSLRQAVDRLHNPVHKAVDQVRAFLSVGRED